MMRLSKEDYFPHKMPNFIGTAAAIAAGVGAAAGIGGAAISASAQDRATKAQETQAERFRKENIDFAKTYAPMQPSEMAAVNKLLTTSQTRVTDQLNKLDQQQKILDAMDPQVKAAGGNLLNLLSGQNAKMLDPYNKVRDRQRMKMEDDLSSRMGPGWRTSSAGIEAMLKFDEETGLQTAQIQQQATQQAAGIYSQLYGQQATGAQGISNTLSDISRQDVGAHQIALGAEQAGATRLSNALQGAGSNTMQMIDIAGKEGQGAIGIGQTLGNLGTGLTNIGIQQAGFNRMSDLFGSTGGGGSSDISGGTNIYQAGFNTQNAISAFGATTPSKSYTLGSLGVP